MRRACKPRTVRLLRQPDSNGGEADAVKQVARNSKPAEYNLPDSKPATSNLGIVVGVR